MDISPVTEYFETELDKAVERLDRLMCSDSELPVFGSTLEEIDRNIIWFCFQCIEEIRTLEVMLGLSDKDKLEIWPLYFKRKLRSIERFKKTSEENGMINPEAIENERETYDYFLTLLSKK